MSYKDFTIDVQFNENQALGFVPEQFDPLSLPVSAKEGRSGYHTIWKVPVFWDGFDWQKVASQQYVNSSLEGLAWKDDCRVATVADIDIANDLNAGDSIDDIVLVTDDRVLVKDQVDKAENGIWIVGAFPVRSGDMDESAEFNNAVVSINVGTINEGITFRCTTINPSVNVDDIDFSNFGTGVPDATELIKGKIAIASLAEMEAATSHNKSATPLGVEHVLAPVRSLVEKLIPLPPDDLAGKTLIITLYEAREATTGTIISNLTDDTQPTGSVSSFYDGNTGTLTAWIDLAQDGERVLTTADDTGVYDSLEITADEDPYAGQQGKEDFYKQLDADVKSDTSLTVGEHTYQMKHSVTGDSAVLTFVIDDPVTSTISAVSITLPGANTRFISGIPSLDTTDTILVSFDVNDAVKTHYNSVNLAKIIGSNIDTVYGVIPGTPPDLDDIVSYVDLNVSVNADVWVEDLGFSIYGINSKNIDGTESVQTTGARADTISDESEREEAGSGQYPTTGLGGAFDSTQSLKSVYTEELQLLNGKYQIPRGDYSANLPTAGEDYDIGMGVGDRWYYYKHPVTLSDITGFTINLLNAEDFTSEVTSGIKIYARIAGVTGWVDCNASYLGSGDPFNDGDPAMVFSESDGDTKRVTFGSAPRSGDLEIRIAIESGYVNKKFSGINVTNIT